MDDPRVLHRRAGENAADVIARIPAERLGDPTPCTEWDVRGVINHMVNGNLRFAALVAGKPGPERGEDVLGNNPLAAFRGSVGELCAAFDREGVLDQTFPTPPRSRCMLPRWHPVEGSRHDVRLALPGPRT